MICKHPATSLRTVSLGLTLVALVLLNGCAVSEVDPKVFTDYDPGTRYSTYRTFAWQTPPLVSSSPRPIAPETRDFALQETATLLTAKGLQQVQTATDADLLVSVVVGSRSGLVVNNYPGRWGGNYSDLREVTTAGLGVEIFNRETTQRLWTGWATTGLTAEVYANRQDVIKEILTMVLAEYPPRTSEIGVEPRFPGKWRQRQPATVVTRINQPESNSVQQQFSSY